MNMEWFKTLSLTLPILVPGLVLIAVLKLHLFKFLDIPMDFRMSLSGKRIFGANKTFKGAIVMVLMAILVSYVLHISYKSSFNAYINPIFANSPINIGIIYSFSYILGELINSFFKRQLNISAGKITRSNFKSLQEFFDLSDGIIIAVIALAIFTSASINHLLVAGFIGIFLHYSTDMLMKKLSLK